MATEAITRPHGVRSHAVHAGEPCSVPACHFWLPYWLSACGHDGDLSSPRALKLALKEHGIHAQGMRTYGTCGDRMFAVLSAKWIRRDNPETSLRAAVGLLRLLQDAHVEGDFPAELVRVVVSASRGLHQFEEFPVALFRAAWREVADAAEQGTTVEAAVAERIAPVLPIALREWLREPPDHNQVKQGWVWVRKRFGAQALARAEPSGRREWNTSFTRARFGGLDFLPLFNAAALEQEGEQMDHCIADYVNPRAMGGSFHAFSVRQPGTGLRLATMTLARTEAGSWVLDGLAGKCNEEPSEAVTRAAGAFTAWMNRNKRAGGS